MPFIKQAFWKGYKQRKSYVDRLKVLQGNVAATVKVRYPYILVPEYVLSLVLVLHHLESKTRNTNKRDFYSRNLDGFGRILIDSLSESLLEMSV